MTSAIRALLLTPLVLLVVGTAGLVILRIHGQQLLSVQTASMVPAFRPGDALVVRPVVASDLRLGQVISYHSLEDQRVIISHRLVAINHQTGLLMTSGDALRSQDQAFSATRVVGRVVAVAPRLGVALTILRRPVTLCLVLYVPALGLIISEARQLARHFGG